MINVFVNLYKLHSKSLDLTSLCDLFYNSQDTESAESKRRRQKQKMRAHVF